MVTPGAKVAVKVNVAHGRCSLKGIVVGNPTDNRWALHSNPESDKQVLSWRVPTP